MATKKVIFSSETSMRKLSKEKVKGKHTSNTVGLFTEFG